MDESHGPGKRSYARSFPQTDALADRAARLSKWLTQESRFVSGNRELLDQFCARVVEAGVPLSRSWLHIRTLHPEFAGVSESGDAAYKPRSEVIFACAGFHGCNSFSGYQPLDWN
jgi:hypothetical protein